VLLWPYIPASAERLLAALGVEDVGLASAQLGTGAVVRVAPIEALFPKEQAAAGPA
jgi:methionyl-tRNA synthetase